MSYAPTYDELGIPNQFSDQPPMREMIYTARSTNQWIPMVLPVLFCGISWACGGLGPLTDMGFVTLTVLCLIFTISEFLNFSRRFGIGGLLLYGGVLIWFCHDYLTHWLGRNFNDGITPFSADIVAKAAFYHCLFILMMVIGIQIRGGRWLSRLILAIPEPGSELFSLMLLLLMTIVGFSPFFLMTKESFLTSLYKGAFGAWVGPVEWTVFRSGNINYRWDAYAAQLIQIGEFGGIFGSIFAILISRHWWSKLLGWTLWAYWTIYLFGGGRRGELAFMVLPPLAMLFIKYQAIVAMKFRRHSFLAYFICGILGLALIVAVQIQGSFRDIGFGRADYSQLDVTQSQGNTMFSEGLLGWKMIPDSWPFFRSRFPGEGFVRAMPEQVFWFLIGPIPRALWNDKPIDPLWEWYNRMYTGNANGTVGTTIAHGLVGSWYFNYGFWGIVEGGLLVGWLMSISERALRESNGQPVGMMMSLGFAVWLFRIYRDFQFLEIYGLLVGGVALALLVLIFRPLMGGGGSYQIPASPI